MFATKKKMQLHREYVKAELDALNDKYWVLRQRHERLLQHFGLSEHEIPPKVELRTKGGPEKT